MRQTRGIDQLIITGKYNQLEPCSNTITAQSGRRFRIALNGKNDDDDRKQYRNHSTWIEPEKKADGSGFIAYHAGIESYFNTDDAHSYVKGNLEYWNRFETVIHGQWLTLHGIGRQFNIYRELRKRDVNISSLHLKVAIKSPQKSISQIAKMLNVGDESKPLSKDLCGFRNACMISLSSKLAIGSCNSLYLGNRKANQHLLIYDPFLMHGETDSQHWELRIRGKYMKHVLHLLDSCETLEQFECMVQSLVFGAVDFRKGNDKNLNRRKRHKWYSELIKGVERIPLMQNATFDKKFV